MGTQDDLSNPQLVTIALHNLGGSVNPIDLEDVAIEAYKLAPTRFSWKKYADRIDLRIVLYSLNDAIKSDIGFVSGNSKHGYMITEAGLEWVSQHDDAGVSTTSSRKLSAADLVSKEKLRLERTKAYLKYLNNKTDQINIIDFREFTRVNDYFPQHLREQRYAKIENAVRGDQQLMRTWKFLKKKFKEE